MFMSAVKYSRVFCAILSGFFITACVSQTSDTHPADIVYMNGRIQTVSANNDWAEAVAIRDGRISAVGSNEDISSQIGENTQRVDLDSAYMMPGFIDQHVHAFFAGEEELYFCKISDSFSFDEILEAVSKCADERDPDEWIQGGPWGSQLLGEFSKASTRTRLDAAAKGHPLILRDDSAHNVVVNSAALALIGYDDQSGNPPDGEIVRDETNGKITGLLFESAARKAHKTVPARSVSEYAAAAAKGVSTLNSLGVTTMLEASVTPRVANAYHYLDNSAGVNLRAALALSTGVLTSYSEESLENLIAMRDTFRSDNVLPDYAKFFLDGIPPTFTANFIDPYLPTKKLGDDFHGPLYYSDEDLSRLVSLFDAEGVSVKIHATGDGSVRAALNAVQAARKRNGNSGPVHQIAHAGFIHPDDLVRFHELDVAVDSCPTLWYNQPIVDAIAFAIGEERAEHYWPFRSLVEKSAIIALGSDWPVLPSANPLLGVEAMVTRRNPVADESAALWPEEAINLTQAIRAATIEGAIALNLQDETGSIEVGKSADLIILDRNLFDIPIDAVSETKVVQTIYRGSVVFERE